MGENGELGKEEEEARDELRFHTKVVDEEVEPGRERERERLDAHFQGERQLKLPVVRQNLGGKAESCFPCIKEAYETNLGFSVYVRVQETFFPKKWIRGKGRRA